MKTPIVVLLTVLLFAANAHSLDISLTPWKQATSQLGEVLYAVDGVIVGYTANAFRVSFSVDGWATAIAQVSYRPLQPFSYPAQPPAHRGLGVFQVETNLYRINDGKLVNVAHSRPGAFGTSTAVNGARWITVAENIVYVSADSGATWTEYLNPWGQVNGTKVSLTEVYFDGESFVGTGTGTWRSVDGTLWHQVTDLVVEPVFSGELGVSIIEPDINSDIKSRFFVLRGESLVPLAFIDLGYAIALAPGGVFAWSNVTLRFHSTEGTTVETDMPQYIKGVLRRSDQSIRVFTVSPSGATLTWDSLPLTEPPFKQPVISSIAMIARLGVTGMANTAILVEGSPAPNGPWAEVGSVLLNSVGKGTWTDNVAADRAGWFYRMKAR